MQKTNNNRQQACW